MKMIIVYRDEVGTVTEEVDEYGITCCGEVFFNDKKIPFTAVEQIRMAQRR